MNFITVKHMKLCPNSCEGWLTLLEWSNNWWTTYQGGPWPVSLPAVWKHTVNPGCKYEERIA